MAITPTPRMVMALPDLDFDTTEAAIPWARFIRAGIDVTFATERGDIAQCDPRLLKSGIFKPFPADAHARAAYQRMTRCPRYQRPIRFDDIDPDEFDAVHLPGGHAPGMRQYLESVILQEKVAEMKRRGKLIGAICHGVLVPARAVDPATGRGLIDGYTVTTLTKPLEMFTFAVTFFRVGRRFRTYPRYTEDEVREAVGDRGAIVRGDSIREPFVITDRELITARCPLDSERHAQAVITRLRRQQAYRRIRSRHKQP